MTNNFLIFNLDHFRPLIKSIKKEPKTFNKRICYYDDEDDDEDEDDEYVIVYDSKTILPSSSSSSQKITISSKANSPASAASFLELIK